MEWVKPTHRRKRLDRRSQRYVLSGWLCSSCILVSAAIYYLVFGDGNLFVHAMVCFALGDLIGVTLYQLLWQGETRLRGVEWRGEKALVLSAMGWSEVLCKTLAVGLYVILFI